METRTKKFKGKQEKIIKEERSIKRKKRIKRMLLSLFILFTLFVFVFSYITFIGTKSLIVYEEKITTSRLPSVFHGLKVIVFSDLHYPSTFLDKDLEALEDTINIRKPDLIFFTGDLLSNEKKVSKKEQQKVQQFLNQLDAKLGKYAVLGETDNETSQNILTTAHFQVLNDQYDLIYQKEMNPILIIGLDSRQKTPHFEQALSYFNMENATQDIFSIALFHHPNVLTSLAKMKQVDFAFAGHTHQGQVTLPFINMETPRDMNQAKKMHYTVQDTELYISSGLGTTGSPYRFFARPSIFFFRFTTS